MKILHYSDKRDENFISLYKECEMLITSGDLSTFDFGEFELVTREKPAFGVYGNHDDGCNYLDAFGMVNLHNNLVEYQGLKFGGFQGCLRYNTRDMQYSEEEAKDFADNFPYVDVLVLHAGPAGLLDDPKDAVHVGSTHIRKYVDEKRPRFIFCGHQYSQDYMEYGNTKIYRAYGANLLDVPLF